MLKKHEKTAFAGGFGYNLGTKTPTRFSCLRYTNMKLKFQTFS